MDGPRQLQLRGPAGRRGQELERARRRSPGVVGMFGVPAKMLPLVFAQQRARPGIEDAHHPLVPLHGDPLAEAAERDAAIRSS
jgi:hypothetical protein